jgi:hypothetical protein
VAVSIDHHFCIDCIECLIFSLFFRGRAIGSRYGFASYFLGSRR